MRRVALISLSKLASCPTLATQCDKKSLFSGVLNFVQPKTIRRCCSTEAGTSSQLRFHIGDIVLCNMGKKGWQKARVMAHNHREASWPSGHVAPYVVQLQEGIAFVPLDDPRLIKAASKEEVAAMLESERNVVAMAESAQTYKKKQLDVADSLDLQGRLDLSAIVRYHADSCHVHPGLYANGGAMDWDNQPDKFRRMRAATSVDLPQSSPDAHVPESSPWWDLQRTGVLLHDSCGITAWKGHGQARWSLRANPSSGALQPLEVYIFGKIADMPPMHWHYNAFWHSLELVASLPLEHWRRFEAQLPEGAIVVGLTSIVWRNAWKYGDPGFRYTHHDVGHQISSFAFAAASQGASVVLLDSLTDNEICALLRPDSPEEPVCLLAIIPSSSRFPSEEWWRHVELENDFWANHTDTRFHGAPVDTYYGKPEEEARPLIATARTANRRVEPPPDSFWAGGAPSLELPSVWKNIPLRSLIHKRRSAQKYNPALAPKPGLAKELFFEILVRTLCQPVWFPWGPTVQPFIFVHRVAGLDPGIYLLCRGKSSEQLKGDIDPTGRFAWEAVSDAPDELSLVLLTRGDVRREAKLGSCVQDIASDSAFAVAFLVQHLPLLEKYGAWWYTRAHWEACALGGAMYLAAGAASAGLQATGIGCFFAPWVQAWLGVDAPRWADVYHFTIGWPERDRRIDEGKPPYHHVDALRNTDRDDVDTRGA